MIRDPRSLLTPRMAGVLDRIARAARPPLHTLTPREARAAYEAGAEILEQTPGRVAHIRDFTLPARDGAALHARLYRAESADANASPVLLYLHGGGLVIGSIATHDLLCRDLCARSSGCVVSMDYRLAPEHPFPAAFADDLDGVAPACIVLAECDPLVDEGVAYADRLRAAGVAVTLDLLRGVTHEFIRMGRALPEADAAREFASRALVNAWNRT